MHLTAQIARHFKEVFFGGNWTSVNLRESLAGVSWQQATTQVHSFNTIAMLVFHINYYVSAVLEVLKGGSLDAHDKYSFEVAPIHSASEWENLMAKTWRDSENFAELVEQFPENKLWENFSGDKYGNYYRNLLGVIEHTHYHLGQIILLKKIIQGTETDANRIT